LAKRTIKHDIFSSTSHKMQDMQSLKPFRIIAVCSGEMCCSKYCYCCNLSVGIALNVRFTTNGMCAENNTHICVVQTSN